MNNRDIWLAYDMRHKQTFIPIHTVCGWKTKRDTDKAEVRGCPAVFTPTYPHNTSHECPRTLESTTA